MKDHNISSSFILYQNSGELSDIENELLQKAIEARANAYAPYSEFNVGASLLMDDGSVFTGNNQENAAYPSGICAERVDRAIGTGPISRQALNCRNQPALRIPAAQKA